MKRVFIIILAITLLLLAMAFTSCSKEHVHNFKDKVVAPTCVTEGYTEHTCQDPECNYVMRDTVTAKNPEKHSGKLEDPRVTDPTCEMGYTTYTCSACHGEVVKDYTNPVHDLGDWEPAYSETVCPNDSVMQRACEKCDYIEQDLVTSEHLIQAENDEIVAPTYYNSGYTKHTCDCRKNYVIDTYVLPLSVSEYLEVELCDGYYMVTGLKEGATVTNVIIPHEVNGIPVTMINYNAFANSNITYVFIPASVETIRADAFIGCDDLAVVDYDGEAAQWDKVAKGTEWNSYKTTVCVNVYLHSSVQKEHYIQNANVVAPTTLTSGYTYHYCACEANNYVDTYVAPVGSDALKFELRSEGGDKYYAVVGFNSTIGKSVVIPFDYMGIPVREIGYDAFLDCDVIKTVTLTTNIKYIRSTAFYYCYNLEKIVFKGTEAEWNAVVKGEGWNTAVTLEFEFNK